MKLIPVTRNEIRYKFPIYFRFIEKNSRMTPFCNLFMIHSNKNYRVTVTGAWHVHVLVGEVVAHCEGSGFKWATNQSERNKLWTARHNAFYAVLSARPNCRVGVSRSL